MFGKKFSGMIINSLSIKKQIMIENDITEEEYNELYGDNFVYFSILNEITKHMKLYPDEKEL